MPKTKTPPTGTKNSKPKPKTMKAHRYTTSVLLVLLVSVGAASAQTSIPASLKATPGSWNPAVQGFVVRSHQIAVPRTPGDPNSIANVEKELNGGFGANLAAPGPNAGYYLTNVLDFADTPFSDGGQLFFNDFPFPGIDLDPFSPNYNPSNFVIEAITYLDLPAGTNYLGVRSDDSFRLSIGLGNNPLSYAALTPAGALFNASRGPANNIFAINVTNAGVYPVRIVYGQGGGGANLEFWSTNDYFGTPTAMLINDPSYVGYALVSYVPSSLPITPTNAYTRFLSPLPSDNNASALPTMLAELQDAGTTVIESSVILRLDGNAVSANVVKVSGVTTATFTPGSLLGFGAHTASVSFQDSALNWTTNTWSFTVPSFVFVTLPASWSYPVGSQNMSEPGFNGRVKVLRSTAPTFSSTVAVGDANLDGLLVDAETGEPYVNLAANTTNDYFGAPLEPGINWFGYMLTQPGGFFTETNVINYSADGLGAVQFNNFGNTYVDYADTNYPGLPGADDTNYANYANATDFAIELRGFIHLAQGLQVLGLHAGDGCQLAFHPNDVRDIFRVGFVQRDVNVGAANLPAVLDVEAAGLYSFRVLQQKYDDTPNQGLEFWSAPFTNQTARTLVNAVNGVKVYRSLTVPTRSYVRSISPTFAQTGVLPNSPIQVTLANLGAAVPVLRVNGSVVSYVQTTNASDVTLTYTPAQPFGVSELVTAEVRHGNAVSAWSYVTKGVGQALYVAGGAFTQGDALNASRLASVHKLDVTFVTDADAANPAKGTNLAAGMSLIMFSSSALAGANNITARRFQDLPIPIINWEQGYTPHLIMRDGGGGGGTASATQLQIVNEGHPLAGGLANGTHTIASAGYVMQHSQRPPEAVGIATDMNGTPRDILWGLTNGATVAGFTHPARRVFLGFAGDNGASFFNDTGRQLFDAAVNWVLPPKPPELSITTATVGNVTISWTAAGVLEESTNMAPGSWSDSPNQANPQTRAATGTKFFRIRQ